MSTDEGTVLGRAYYNPDLGLAVESIFDQSLIRHSTSVRMNNTVRKGDTNSPGPGSVPAMDLASGDITVDGTAPPSTAPPLVVAELRGGRVAVPGSAGALALNGNGPGQSPPMMLAGTNFTTTSTTTTSQWHVVVKLLEVETVLK